MGSHRDHSREMQQSPYGDLGGGFWVVAIIGRFVAWFNDIEDGFNVSRYSKYGVIGEYWCNQDELEWAMQRVLHSFNSRKAVCRARFFKTRTGRTNSRSVRSGTPSVRIRHLRRASRLAAHTARPEPARGRFEKSKVKTQPSAALPIQHAQYQKGCECSARRIATLPNSAIFLSEMRPAMPFYFGLLRKNRL